MNDSLDFEQNLLFVYRNEGKERFSLSFLSVLLLFGRKLFLAAQVLSETARHLSLTVVSPPFRFYSTRSFHQRSQWFAFDKRPQRIFWSSRTQIYGVCRKSEFW